MYQKAHRGPYSTWDNQMAAFGLLSLVSTHPWPAEFSVRIVSNPCFYSTLQTMLNPGILDTSCTPCKVS